MPGLPAARRTVLKGAALAGAAGLGAAACSTDSKLGHAQTPTPTAPVELGAAEEVPVGGAKLYREQRVVVSCQAAGQYKAFSAQCTHMRLPPGQGRGQRGQLPLPRQPLRRDHGQGGPGPGHRAAALRPREGRGRKARRGPRGLTGRPVPGPRRPAGRPAPGSRGPEMPLCHRPQVGCETWQTPPATAPSRDRSPTPRGSTSSVTSTAG